MPKKGYASLTLDQETLQKIDQIIEELERKHPELGYARLSRSGVIKMLAEKYLEEMSKST